MRHYLRRLEKSSTFWILTGFLILFFLLRLPSLIEPYWYGDEGIYQTIGFALQENRSLYTEIWDNKTPLLYSLYTLFGPEQTSMRLVSLLFGLGCIGLFFSLAMKLFDKRKPSLFATGLFTLLFGFPMLEGNIANAENFMLLPVIASALIFIKQFIPLSNKSNRSRPLLLSGILLGIGFLFKTVALFDGLAFLLFFLFLTLPHHFTKSNFKQYFLKNYHRVLFFLLGMGIPFLLSLSYFLVRGSLPEYINAAFFGNVSYVGVQNTALILGIKVLFLLFSLFIIFQKRKVLTPSLLFISLWFVFSLFNSFFSHRPYTHYMLVLLPSICLLFGHLFIKRQPGKKIIVGILLITIIVILQFFDNWSLRKSLSYYGNFASFVTGTIPQSTYSSFFDSRTPRDEDVALYLKQHLDQEETVFFWGDNAQMYYLTNTLPPGRFTVAYHILASEKSLEETRLAYEKVQPTYIVIFPTVSSFPFPMYNYQQRLSIQGALIYEKLY